jgi:hypothetical protein
VTRRMDSPWVLVENCGDRMRNLGTRPTRGTVEVRLLHLGHTACQELSGSREAGLGVTSVAGAGCIPPPRGKTRRVRASAAGSGSPAVTADASSAPQLRGAQTSVEHPLDHRRRCSCAACAGGREAALRRVLAEVLSVRAASADASNRRCTVLIGARSPGTTANQALEPLQTRRRHPCVSI